MPHPITFAQAGLQVPDDPIIPFIQGDGIGPEVWAATRQVVDAALWTIYRGRRTIHWSEVLAGQRAYDETGSWLPDETLTSLTAHLIAIKGPLTTPVAGGIRSLNVQLRRELDLYANVRPVRWFPGLPSPLRQPELVSAVIFRENTEDVYAGYEVAADSEEARLLRGLLKATCGWELTDDTGIGLKPISRTASTRLVRAAMRYAVDRKRQRVTLVHKGNIMKYTEGAFRDWGYQVVRDEFADHAVLFDDCDGDPGDRILVQDRIADAMFQDILLSPERHQVIATTNLNGDYLSDALAAQIGGIGVSPGANLNDELGRALYEAVHGTAPDIVGRDLANPTAMLFSAEMLLRRIGWTDAADHIETAVEATIAAGAVTADLAARVDGARPIGTREFTDTVLTHIG
ncbi:MAG: NADP-dependent isocitrate dehydrogenase [Actinobacteria bacterium]|jgi:isocitrate dehydrogenase|nr:NADP-dependent isocitrate dehydrogenase [Actinomycetota bacterium]